MAFASINQTSVGGGSSNALSIQSDGIFMPRLSTAQRTALALTTSDTGLTVYDFTLNNLFIWNGTAWESIPGSGDAGANGSVQYNDNGTVSGATNFVWDKVNGRVGIGTATPSVPLDVLGSGDGELRIRAGSDAALIFSETAANKNWKVKPSGGDLCFQYSATAFNSGYANKMVLNSIGNLVLAGGTAAANGVGVTFPAVQVASSDANCLDDYEEGTWQGTLTGGGGATNPTTAVIATGRYTKIGRLVTVSINYESVITTGASGNIGISGLPFANNASVQSVGPTSIYQAGTFTGSPFVRVDTAASVIEFFASVSNAVYSNVTHNAGTGRFIATSVSYTVA